ncbi:InlB B-repeat-containing protein [Bifidobacterium sp. A11]|uniref:RCC1 domain-containing protein n=1 Tax=Bifidobacterium sp. A11 TaxID=1394176 RepID=UPI00345EEA3B
MRRHRGGGVGQTPRVAKRNSGIFPSKATPTATSETPQSPLATPSPLNTSSPLEPIQPTASAAPSTNTENPQTRSAAQYTVKFTDTEGGTTTPDQTVNEGAQALRPADPARPNYSFDGWFISGTLTAYDFSQPVASDMTLEARWTKNGDVWDLSPTQGPTAGNTLITLTAPPARTIRFSQFSAGYQYSVAVGSDGSIYHWGEMYGSDYNWQPSREDTPAGLRFIQVSAGYDHSLALDSEGNLYSWGSSSYGQLGRNTYTTPADTPGKVDAPAGIRFTQVSAGKYHSEALASDGSIYSWGYNSDGELGRGTITTPTTRPGKVDTPTGIRFTQITSGYDYCMAFDTDGNLYSWGGNGHGQLGRDASTTPTGSPGKVDTPAAGVRYTQVIAKGMHCLALDSNGVLYSWGYNNFSQLGRYTGSTKINPRGKVNVPTKTRIIQISAGDWNGFALDDQGILYTWGNNSHAQLARPYWGATDPQPTKIDPPAKNVTYIQVIGGGDHAVAIGSDGNLYSWGRNSNGQLGRDTNKRDSYQPGTIPLTNHAAITSIKFGGTPGTGLTANPDGTWNVTTPPHSKGWVNVTITWSMNGPQPDAYLSYTYTGPKYSVGFTSVDAACPAASGMPGDQSVTEGNQVKRPYPDPKADGCLFDGWFLKDAKGGSNVAYDFSQPVTADITLVAHWSPANTGGWSISPVKGSSMGGQQATVTPPKISRGIRFSQVSAGGYQAGDFHGFSVGVASDGNAYAWGSNQHGQLGQGTADSSTQKTPVKVPLPDGVAAGFTYTQAVAGGYHVLAIGSNGIVYSWGANDHGQLGDGTTTDHSKPQPVPDPSDKSQPFKAAQVSAGAYDSAAIDQQGRVYTWGSENNNYTAYSASKLTPKLAKDPNGSNQGLHAAQVSLGWSFIMAIDTDGSLYAWGYDNYGQLGNGAATGEYSTTYAADPAPVPDPANTSRTFKASQISAGANHALAISQDGAAWAWGYNDHGQLGDGTTTSRPSPRQVPSPTGSSQGLQAARISAGVHHSLAVDQNGASWAWGWNSDGQLGNGNTSDQPKPTRVSPPAGQGKADGGLTAARASAGRNHSLAIGQDGNAYAWGDNTYSQLGNGGTTQSSTPALVAFNPVLLITGVSFDQTVVSVLRQNSDGSVTLSTPAHNPGQADVIVDWTLGGIVQPQAHLAYTYEGMLPHAGSNGTMILLLAAGLLAAAGAVAAGRHRREARSLQA